MKALILNSGTGSRLGSKEKGYPKCMTVLSDGKTILERQLHVVELAHVDEIIITTGLFHDVLIEYVDSLKISCPIRYIHNPLYDRTNYIYSVFLAKEFLNSDLLLMHGDLVFENAVLEGAMQQEKSSVIISSTCPLPKKDFKAQVADGRILKIGVDVFENASSLQPLYMLKRDSLNIWMEEITAFCNRGETGCYAENAFNSVAARCGLYGFDIKNQLCGEIDCEADLKAINALLERG